MSEVEGSFTSAAGGQSHSDTDRELPACGRRDAGQRAADGNRCGQGEGESFLCSDCFDCERGLLACARGGDGGWVNPVGFGARDNRVLAFSTGMLETKPGNAWFAYADTGGTFRQFREKKKNYLATQGYSRYVRFRDCRM